MTRYRVWVALWVVALAILVLGCVPASPHPGMLTPPAEAAAGSCKVVDGRADRSCAPGASNPLVTQANIATTVCRRGWTATVRPPVSYIEPLKRQQLGEYGESGRLSGYEEDHLIPLELGGAPRDPRNLWPEPRTGAHNAAEKDREEDALNRAVCNRRMTLTAARDKIVADWTH